MQRARPFGIGAVTAFLLLLGLTQVVAEAPRRLEAAALIELLRQPGHVALMRHALAPFEGAPREGGKLPEQLGPCETQRNLNQVGRDDARRLGELFRREGLVFEAVFTSKWCRCRETAELMMGRPVDNLPLIDSYFTSPDKATRGPAQIAALKQYLATALRPTDRALLVSHGSLISDLAGIDTDEAEIVVVKSDRRGGIVVVGHGVL
jgi:phosphohistidine phosphatase SixA